jgi:acetylornithine deacetylase/succinyl-diaminopimelate desuccinylase-like protein
MDVIQILKDLIAIPSVNPMQTGTGQPVEREVADYVESFLRRQGIDCERQAVLEGRENVIAILHPSPASSQTHIDGLMLNSHMDTVPVAHMEIDPFDPVLRQGRIYGRGACDAKGSIAVMLAALSMHSSRSFRPRLALSYLRQQLMKNFHSPDLGN